MNRNIENLNLLKLTYLISGSFKNIIHTLAEKSQLKLCHQLISPLRKVVDCSEGSLIGNSDYDLFFKTKERDKNSIREVHFVDVMGTLYKLGMVVTVNASSVPIFGAIEKIFVSNGENVYFLCKNYLTLYFDKHYHAFVFELWKMIIQFWYLFPICMIILLVY